MRLIKRILQGASYPAKAVARYLLHEDLKELNKLILYVQDERVALERKMVDWVDKQDERVRLEVKRVEELTEKLDDLEMPEIDYSAVDIDYGLLGSEIDYYDLSTHTEYSDVAKEVDVNDVASAMDTADVATSLSELISVSIKLK